ncbi:MAG: hypothetical protein ABWZ57_13730 [Mesorhizobium sp.]
MPTSADRLRTMIAGLRKAGDAIARRAKIARSSLYRFARSLLETCDAIASLFERKLGMPSDTLK